MSLSVVLVAARSSNNVIGRDGTLPWEMPDDLRWFKDCTMGSCVIMGRKTAESVGRLKDRVCIVISNQPEEVVSRKCPTYIHVNSLEEALALAEELAFARASICGGETIYREALSKGLVDAIWLTEVKTTVDGDAFFPEEFLPYFEKDRWKKVFHRGENGNEHYAEATVWRRKLVK